MLMADHLARCIEALNTCKGTKPGSFMAAAVRAHEGNKLPKRTLPAQAVGQGTFLIEGLEAEVAVMLDMGDMDASPPYAVVVHGPEKLVVCS